MLQQAWRIISTVLGLLFRHPLTGVSVVPVLADGRIVLVQRRDNGRWGLPGGLVDWGENITTTVSRELREETGLTVEKLGRLVGVYSAVNRDPRMHSVCVVVEAHVAGPFEIHDHLEIQAIQAFTREQLPLGTLAHDHDRQLQDYLDGETVLC